MDSPLTMNSSADASDEQTTPPPTSPLSSPPHGFLDFAIDDEFDDDIDLLSHSDNPDVPHTPYTDRQTTAQKLESVLHAIQKAHWTFPQFIRAWACAGEKSQSSDVEINSRTYRTMERRRRALNNVVEELLDNGTFQTTSLSEALVKAIANELDKLIEAGEYFGRLTDEDIDSSRIESLDFGKAGQTVKRLAPTWHNLLQQLLKNQRSHRESYTWSASDSNTIAISKRLFAITSQVCHSRAKKTSNFFPSMLGVYLLGTGTKRRVLQTLAGLGLCPSYPQVNRTMEKIANICEVYTISSLNPLD
jgi:hypothetical protein